MSTDDNLKIHLIFVPNVWERHTLVILVKNLGRNLLGYYLGKYGILWLLFQRGNRNVLFGIAVGGPA